MKLGILSTDFEANIRLQNFMKIRPLGAELVRAEGQTDGRVNMTKLIVAFRSFANAPRFATNWDVRTRRFLLHTGARCQ